MMERRFAKPCELVIVHSPDIITSMALGSSLAICLYDGKNKIGGLVQSIYPKNPKALADSKYVDSAIHLLYEKMIAEGAQKKEMIAKLVGGARLFQLHIDGFQEDIGNRNVMAAYETLEALQLPICNADVGDVFGRTIHFHSEDGSAYIETKRQVVYHI